MAQLATIVLDSGRTAYLRTLRIQPTYGGFPEGYPTARINAQVVRRLRGDHDRIGSAPVHVIEPVPRHMQDAGRRAPGPWEELPSVLCRGLFISASIVPGAPADGSHLEVVWFQDHLLVPVAEFAAAAIRALPWNDLAADYEM